MKSNDSNKYSASLTAGSLLLEETEACVPYFLKHGTQKLEPLIGDNKYLKINSEASRKRKTAEVRKRYQAIRPELWQDFLTMNKKQKFIFLYYVSLNAYPVLKDFQFEVLLKKWRELNTEVSTEDVLKFLSAASDDHPEIEKWTEKTRHKVAQVMILMLNECGLIKEETLTQSDVNESFWKYFVRIGEGWFLEAMFLSKDYREVLVK